MHAQELGYWYSMQAARLRERLGFRLVLTVWETIPMLDAYRNFRTRAYRAATLAQTDLFLAASERARDSLLLEGAPAERIRVCAPGRGERPLRRGRASDVRRRSDPVVPADPLTRAPGLGEGTSGRAARARAAAPRGDHSPSQARV